MLAISAHDNVEVSWLLTNTMHVFFSALLTALYQAQLQGTQMHKYNKVFNYECCCL